MVDLEIVTKSGTYKSDICRVAPAQETRVSARSSPAIIECNEHTVNATSFRKILISWGRKNFRIFPWRLTDDPYRLLIAEIMLHRTQARQVVPVYNRFIEAYPDLQTLAHAPVEDLRKVLYPLGLPGRVDHFISMIDELMTRFNGQIPSQKSDILSLTGVSEYIASAVRCFGFHQPEALVDTNTVRVIGRVFLLEMKDSSRRNPLFRKLISALADPRRPEAYNYALLDLADEVCTKKRPPDCLNCPVRRWCLYGTLALSMPDKFEIRKV